MSRALILAGLALLGAGPVLLLLVWSFADAWYWPELLPAFGLRAWRYVLSPASGSFEALLTSLTISIPVAAVSVAIALPAARAIALYRFRGRSALVALLFLPAVAPPLASTLGLHRLFVSYGLTDTSLGVAIAHLVPALPYAVLALIGSFQTFDTALESQARTLGASARRVWTEVTLPAIAPGIGAAFLFAFLVSWNQFLLTLLIGGGRILTLPIHLAAFQRSGDDGIAAALSLIFVAPAVFVGRYLRI